jgi:hypothetical protein
MRMPWKDVVALGALRVLCPSPVPITISTHEKALKIATDLGYEIYDALVPKRGGKAGPDFDLRHSFTEDEAPHLIAKLLYLVGIGCGSKALRQSEKNLLFFFLRFGALLDQFDPNSIVAKASFPGNTLDLLGQARGQVTLPRTCLVAAMNTPLWCILVQSYSTPISDAVLAIRKPDPDQQRERAHGKDRNQCAGPGNVAYTPLPAGMIEDYGRSSMRNGE